METLLDNFIKAIGWSIVHSIWQGALIYALLLPSQMSVFKLSAARKYAIAYTANCLMLLSFVLTFISLFHWPPPHTYSHLDNPPLLTNLVPPLSIYQYTEMAFPFVALCYAIGLFIQSYIVYKGYKKVKELRNASHSAIPEEWEILFARLTGKLNIKKPIAFYLTPHVTVPLVLGYLKPLILFPVSLAIQMDIKQVEAILIHELSHVRRNDYILNLVKTFVETILFFNPFVWLTGKFINIEREHACDDLVVSYTKTPLTYARALLQLELLGEKNTPPLSMAATGTNQHLYQRIKRITDMKTNYMNAKQKIFAITLTIATIVSVVWMNPVKSEKRDKRVQNKENNKAAFTSISIALADTTKKKTKQKVKNKIVPMTPAIVVPVITETITADPALLSVSDLSGPEFAAKLKSSQDSLFTREWIKRTKELTLNNDKRRLKPMFNISPEELQNIQKSIQLNLQLQKSPGSAKYQAKMRKFTEELQAKYFTLEEQAKLKALTAQALATANATEAGLKKWKGLSAVQNTPGVINFTDNSPAGEPAAKKAASAQSSSAQNIKKSSSVKIDRQVLDFGNMNIRMGGNNVVVFSENDEVAKLKQSPEYIELKKKFDKDVEELVNRKIKKELQ